MSESGVNAGQLEYPGSIKLPTTIPGPSISQIIAKPQILCPQKVSEIVNPYHDSATGNFNKVSQQQIFYHFTTQ